MMKNKIKNKKATTQKCKIQWDQTSPMKIESIITIKKLAMTDSFGSAQ